MMGPYLGKFRGFASHPSRARAEGVAAAAQLSQYRMEIEQLGYSITEVYDRTTTFDLSFLNQYNVIVFGNHQKVMTAEEQAAIAEWVGNGGGLLAYSDSAFGGKYDVAGINNTVGQKAVNSIISQFGMQVLTDQGNGTCAMKGSDSDTHPIIDTGGTSLVIEGEGESPVCVERTAGVSILIPFTNEAKVGSSGTVSTNNVGGGMTISDPLYAALALKGWKGTRNRSIRPSADVE